MAYLTNDCTLTDWVGKNRKYADRNGCAGTQWDDGRKSPTYRSINVNSQFLIRTQCTPSTRASQVAQRSMDQVIQKKFINHEEVKELRPEDGNGGSFRVYFDKKKSKLDEQFARQAAAGGQSSKIFCGVTIHVNGHTIPSHQELKQLMSLHGGSFRNYYSRSKVTHFVCNNLPDTKLHQLKHERNPVPIVRPDWIVASIKAGKMLPLQDFFLERIRDAPGQKMLKAFAEHKTDVMAAAEKYPTLAHPGKGTSADPKSAEMDKGIPSRKPADSPPGTPFHNASLHGSSAGCPTGFPEMNNADLTELNSNLVLEDDGDIGRISEVYARMAENPTGAGCWGQAERGADEQRDGVEAIESNMKGADPVEESEKGGANEGGQVDAGWDEARQVAAEKRAACSVLKGPPQTTRSGPEFMETYFKASRLHFIGTWRTRIENLTASMIDASPTPVRDKNVEPVIVHLDMDCFFASAAAVGKPVLKGKPLAVCHSSSSKGSGEVSSANYEARAYGVRANMFMRKAKELCPQLISVPYEFDKYQEISEKVYRITLKTTGCVQPISCDEAFLDITGLGDPEAIVSNIRKQIEEETECTASAGIGPNMLLARLATKEGKPNGQFRIQPNDAQKFVTPLSLGSLPGVGWSSRKAATALGIEKVSDLLDKSKELLQKHFGQKMGDMLYKYARGQDDRKVNPPGARKSIGAECNWGVRFDGILDAKKFLEQLSKEVSARMMEATAKGRTITLKVKRRRVGAPEPRKFLGCGICDSLSRSVTIARFTDSEKEIFSSSWTMLKALGVPAPEIRGVGITVSKFDNDATSAGAKVSLGGVARAKAPPPIHAYDRNKPHPWMRFDDSNKHHPLEKEKKTGSVDSIGGMVEKSNEHKAGGVVGPSTSSRAEELKPEQTTKKMGGPLAAMFANVKKRKADVYCHGKEPLQPPQPTLCPTGPSSPGMQALPPASQIDMDVWDALPLVTRRELENAYSLQQMETIPNPTAKVKKRGNSHKAGTNTRKRTKRVGRPSMTTESRVAKSMPSGEGDASVFGCLTWSQIDPVVLASLPVDIQNEIKVALPRVCLRKTNRSISKGSPEEPCEKPTKRVAPVDHQAELDKLVNGVRDVLNCTSPVDPAALQEVAKQVQDWLIGLDPMSEWMMLGLKRIQSLGRMVDGFSECSANIVDFVQDWVEQKHGLRLNLFNPLLDTT